MTKLLDQAIRAAMELPTEMQDEMARMMLRFAAGEDEVYVLTPEEEASFAKSLDQAARREFAPNSQIEAIWSKYAL